MEKAKIIAIWLECGIDIAPCTADESFPTTGLESIGTIKNKSTTLEATDGETLELKATGGHTVDIVETEGGFALKTTVIEPTKLYKALGLTEDDYDTKGRMKVKTHVVDGRYAARLTPKRVGGMGIEVPVTQISFKPGGSEEEGGSAELTFNFIKGQQDYWYERFKKAASTSPGA
ncbi:hypothetical protein [Paramuribaculum intestinale]|uniref:hypothetical protein n=1 Tax=Paramuribaculum intestinale TaxID=2094151 RepID=UPI002612AE21|nr:hypothetical protein [Paramuribaculum intestinale]